MRSFIEHVNQEIFELQRLIAKEERNIRNAPNGSLRISQSHGRFQCYHITKDKPVNGVFLKHSQEHLIADLAQKSYDKKVLRSSRRMLAGLLRLRRNLPDVLPEDVYKTLHPLRRSLVRPVLLPEEDFVRAWEEERWHGKYIDPDGPQLFTEKGELVRSKSEIIIANTLYHLGIPYRYECALDLNDITVYPDFTVLHIKQRQVKYLEHFGMVNYPPPKEVGAC